MTNLSPLPPTIAWHGAADGHLELLDQTLLPHQRTVLQLHDVEGVLEAILHLRVRGAPAIGVAAAYGLLLGVRALSPLPQAIVGVTRDIAARLLAARPTAVNLQWALERCIEAVRAEPTLAQLFAEAQRITADEVAMSTCIGQCGKALVPNGGTVLTHCNTGRLATAGDGTALAVLFAAWRDGLRFRVLADETRPLLQGARLTTLELAAAGIPVQVLVDGAGPGLIARGEVQTVIVGADRIAQNGDFANKVGTYGLALACAAHRVPFYVAAPSSTFDLRLASGTAIPIEERDGIEVTTLAGRQLTPDGVTARNPAFDVTPGKLVRAFVTDRGLIEPPFDSTIKGLFATGR